jgi:uncharacterized protein YbcI
LTLDRDERALRQIAVAQRVFPFPSSPAAICEEAEKAGHMQDSQVEHPALGVLASSISNGVVRLLREYTGRGPTRARTHISGDLVSVVLEDTLTKGERSLVQDGQTALVLQARHAYQRTMREDLIALVEETMGRKVRAFLSDNHLDPDVAVESFVLEPEPGAESAEDGSQGS